MSRSATWAWRTQYSFFRTSRFTPNAELASRSAESFFTGDHARLLRSFRVSVQRMQIVLNGSAR